MLTGAMSKNHHVDERASKRRKLKDGVDASASRKHEPNHPAPKPKPSQPPTNHLLACYLAHEFLSRGTLLGRSFDQPEAEPSRGGHQPIPEAEPNARQVYAEVSALLKDDSVHLPGIVNPSQLARRFGI